MPLTTRPTGLGSGHYKDVPDYGIFCGEWCIGRIYETRTGPGSARYTLPADEKACAPQNHAATLEIAKAELRGELEAVEGVGRVGRDRLNQAPWSAARVRLTQAVLNRFERLERRVRRRVSARPAAHLNQAEAAVRESSATTQLNMSRIIGCGQLP